MRVIFIGSGEIGLPALEWLREHHDLVAIVAQPDKPAGRKQVLTPPPTKLFGEQHAIPVLQPRRIREAEALDALAAFEPEVIIVMAYGQILPKALLDLPPHGCWNLHASLLPKYRGAAPIQAAIDAGETESGLTVIWMDEGLDTGDCLVKCAIPLDPRETGGTLHDRLAALSPQALAETFTLLEQGVLVREPQDHAAATLVPKLSRESGLVDWHATPEVIDRRIRAMNPWPAASTGLPEDGGGRKRLKLFFAELAPEVRSTGRVPGEVLETGAKGILVATGGEGALWLTDLQLEGKRRMAAADLLRGTPIPPGTRLGEGEV